MLPDAVRRLAEDPIADSPVWPGAEIVRDEGLVLWFAPPYYPGLAVVQRLRLRDVEASVERVRSFLTRRGVSSAVWQVGPSSTPSDLVPVLRRLGMRDDADPVMKAVVLSTAPSGAPDDVVVKRVTTLAEFELFYRIQQEAFETDLELIERGASVLARVWETESRTDQVATYLAYVDGEPVATARATFARAGVALNGGSTLHDARRGGAYRALVHARWDEAVARGTPFLTVLARPTSYPILMRMGFEDVCDIHVLVDEGF